MAASINNHIDPYIINHFLHVMYCNYIKLVMEQFSFENPDDIMKFISNTHQPHFWNNYEKFTFDKSIQESVQVPVVSNQEINSQINTDFMMVDIYEKDYKHRDYLVKYALNTYYQNKEKIKMELLTYIETCVGLK
jgi:hypothetical protein